MSPLDLLLALYDEAFDRKAWHGTTLYGSLRGLDVATASARPRPGRHNIWETLVHCAYWKYTVRRRLTGEKRGSFALEGSNWFRRPSAVPTRAQPRRSDDVRARRSENLARAFSDDLRLLAGEHRALRDVMAALPESALDSRMGQVTTAHLIRGIAAHDLYHAGQIQLIKKLVRQR